MFKRVKERAEMTEAVTCVHTTRTPALCAFLRESSVATEPPFLATFWHFIWIDPSRGIHMSSNPTGAIRFTSTTHSTGLDIIVISTMVDHHSRTDCSEATYPIQQKLVYFLPYG